MDFADQVVSLFLARPIIARIASVNPDSLQPQVIQIWYTFDGKYLWFTRALPCDQVETRECDHHCAIVIEADSPPGELKGVLIEGEIARAFPCHLVREVKQQIIARYRSVTAFTESDEAEWLEDQTIQIYQMTPLEIHTWISASD